MKCEKCGAEIKEGAQFCSSCGTKVEFATTESITEKVSSENGKYTGKEMLEKIGKFITIGLSVISVIMIIEIFVGAFDKINPIPFIVFIVVETILGWLQKKLTKIPAIAFAAIEIIVLIICFNVASKVGVVECVKGGRPNEYPSITYERAFDDFFSDPVWKSLGKDEDGNKIVKFTGGCTYYDKPAVAEFKFTLYEEQGRFVVSSVKINGEDMGRSGNELILDVFEDYKNNHEK